MARQEQIHKQIQHHPHRRDEAAPIVDIPDNGSGEAISELQVTIERLLGRVTYDLAVNSVESIS